MKKIALIIALGLGLIAPVFAHEQETDGSRESNYSSIRHDRLNSEINHINRMLSHVRGEADRYGAGRHIRRQLTRAAVDIDHINRRARGPFLDRMHVRREIERVHGLLHHIEQELHVRANDFYRWN